jgi:2-polyprenyl-6-methoxyphenol hydroxylase-like FAD-dependent oxidoreductase
MSSGNEDYDVIIVGTRVGGAILGSLLGEKGYTVLALDRAHFPSDTLSTHFFRAPALRAFHTIGVLDEVRATAPQLTVNYNVIDGISFPEPVDRPEDYPFFMSVRRITLDHILVRRLKATPTVKVIEGAIVKALVNENGRVAGLTWKDETGVHQARARVVVGADGIHSFVAKAVKAQAEHEQVAQRAMYYSYFSGVEHHAGPAAEFHYRGNQIAYLMPTDGDLTLLAVSVPITRFGEFKRDPEGSLMGELGLMSDIAPRLPKAQRQLPVQGSGSIPCYMRVPFGPGWVLVGDAGMVMDPWSGQGIDQASAHAVLLAEHLENYLSAKLDWVDALAIYHRERNKFSQKTYRRTSNFASDLRPMTQAALAKRGLK